MGCELWPNILYSQQQTWSLKTTEYLISKHIPCKKLACQTDSRSIVCISTPYESVIRSDFQPNQIKIKLPHPSLSAENKKLSWPPASFVDCTIQNTISNSTCLQSKNVTVQYLKLGIAKFQHTLASQKLNILSCITIRSRIWRASGCCINHYMMAVLSCKMQFYKIRKDLTITPLRDKLNGMNWLTIIIYHSLEKTAQRFGFENYWLEIPL